MKGSGELLLYLDFDGVLHHENVLWHPMIGPYVSGAPDGYVLFQHAELLEQMLKPDPQVRIVLSTSWVRRYGRARSAKQLQPNLREKVVGATFRPNMDEQDFLSSSRGAQVWGDVEKRQPKGWLALDDDGAQWPEWCIENLIKTHPHEGIGDGAVQEEFRQKLNQLCKK